jgi:hypothetical protein
MRPQVTRFKVPVRWAAPQAIAVASGLGWLHGKAIAGDNGRILYGYPQIGMREKYQGYAFPAQLFTGYTARRVATGAIRVHTGGLPSTASPASTLASPLVMAMRTVTVGQMQGAA